MRIEQNPGQQAWFIAWLPVGSVDAVLGENGLHFVPNRLIDDGLMLAWVAVCTENLILIDYVTESPNVNGDDRAALLLPDPVRLAVQVEEPTWGRERGAPTSADRGAAEDAWSCPPHERGSLVLRPAVSMVSVGPEDDHYHPARDPRALASRRFPSVLALEIPVRS